MKCAICNQKIKDSGNSAAPVSDGRCCNACYFEHVVPAKKYRYGVLIPAKGRAKPYEVLNIGMSGMAERLQAAVGGYLRRIEVDSEYNEIILADENAHESNKLMNKAATYLAHSNLCEGDYIAGDVLVLKKDGEEFRFFSYETAKVRAELINNMTECF